MKATIDATAERLTDKRGLVYRYMAQNPGSCQTVLVGDVRDQAHRYGLLDQLRDFGIELVAVEPVGTGDGSPEAGSSDPD